MGEYLVDRNRNEIGTLKEDSFALNDQVRMDLAKKAVEISDSSVMPKEKTGVKPIHFDNLIASPFFQAFRVHHVAIYSDLNRLIEVAANDIQQKHESMTNMENSFMNSSEEFKRTMENLYNEMESKLSQEEEIMTQRLEKKCEEMKNQVNQIIEEKGEQAEILKEKLKQISMLSEDLQKETEDDKSTMEEARTQCQSMLDEIEEYEQLIDESKESVKELQMQTKVEHLKKDKQDVSTCQKIQEEREALIRKLNELREINRCLRDQRDETGDDKVTPDYDNILTPDAYKATENTMGDEMSNKGQFDKLPVNDEISGIEVVEEIDQQLKAFKMGDESEKDNLSKRSYEKIDSKALIFKVLLIGSIGVGRQALLDKLFHFTNQPFNKAASNKENVAYPNDVRIILYQRKLDDINYLIQFMKPPALNFTEKTYGSFFERSDGIILVFDIWTQETLADLEKYYLSNEIHIKTVRKPIYMLLGNKSDVEENDPEKNTSQVSEKRITDFANKLDGDFFKTSAKTGENVQESIDAFLRRLKTVNEKVNESKEVEENTRTGCCRCCFL
uniref:Uncharacterized protein n=1 Tax=Trichobilharzia regenti TaxID=157069 RepID=A0AA85IQZ9_TRIRE|nr:unnamed protein product [Trichobilharzia regenti]